MTYVKTLPDSEAISNENYGYMQRYTNVGWGVVIIGDYVAQWSTNTLEQSVTVS